MHFEIYIYLHKLIHEIFWISHLWQDPNKVSIYHIPIYRTSACIE